MSEPSKPAPRTAWQLLQTSWQDVELQRFLLIELAIGLIIPVIVSVIVAYFTKDLADILFGLLVACVAFVAGLQIQVSLLRMDAPELVKDHLEASHHDLTAQLTQMRAEGATQLQEALDHVTSVVDLQQVALDGVIPKDVFRDVMELLRVYVRVREQFGSDGIFLRRVTTLIDECKDEVSSLEDGEMEVAADRVYSDTMYFLERAKYSIRAISYAAIPNFWPGRGGEYLRANLDLAKAGVHIERVFILDDLNDLDELREIIRAHCDEENIEAKVIFSSGVAQSGHPLCDMAIFDGDHQGCVERLKWDLHMTLQGTYSLTMTGATFSVDPRDVETAYRAWKDIEANAIPACQFLDEHPPKAVAAEVRTEGKQA